MPNTPDSVDPSDTTPTTVDPGQVTTAAPVASTDQPGTTPDPALGELLSRLSTGDEVDPDNKMAQSSVQVVEISVQELKQAISKNPNHPVAQVFSGAIRNIKDHEKVYIEQPDLQGLIQDREVITRFTTVGGKKTRTKFIK